jgi:hypothetical protein
VSTRKITVGRMPRRWGLLSGIDIGADGDPYLDRLRLIETPWFAVFLHHIHRPDKDPDPHDHPWAFWSLVLAGTYYEQIWPDKRKPGNYRYRNRIRFSLRGLSRKSAHLIRSIEGPLWTLVVTGRSGGTESWGFWRDSEFVPWRTYISENGAEEYAAAKAAEDGQVYRTRTGKLLTDADIRDLADEAERGYDLDRLIVRRRPEDG